VQRVVLHELGRLLGRAHPDEGYQDVAAIMNSVVSQLDDLTADDEAGLRFLYPPAETTASAMRHPGGGCAIGESGQPDGLLLLLAVGVCIYLVTIVLTKKEGPWVAK